MTPAASEPARLALREPSSFRDPHGFVYTRAGALYRQINPPAAADWAAFEESGLGTELINKRWLVAHEQVGLELAADAAAVAVIRPEPVPFISYPYEWTFSQLRDAALLTLDVQEAALGRGMSLRDASAFNVQFVDGRPILIDTLSFEITKEGEPWIAYRQFCEHFLAPLAVMALRDPSLSVLLRPHLDGIPLELASRLLPTRTRFRPGLAAHLHLHARAQGSARKHAPAGMDGGSRRPQISQNRLLALIAHLRSTVQGLDLRPRGTTWAEYGDRPRSYSAEAAAAKASIVESMLHEMTGSRVWDLGANTGDFSRIAAEQGKSVLAIDSDWAAAERHYRSLKERHEKRILPLVADVAAPSPALGWASRERRSLLDRADADVVLALAIVHHLAIGRNVPLAEIGALLARLGTETIIEFVPKSDFMVQEMLASREDIFSSYDLPTFRKTLGITHVAVAEVPIPHSERTLIHARRKD